MSELDPKKDKKQIEDEVDDLLSRRNVIYSHLNNDLGEEGAVRVTEFELQEGDIVVAMSDGITDNLTYGEIVNTVKDAIEESKDPAQELINKAQKKVEEGVRDSFGVKNDDMTAVVIEIQ